GGYGADGLLSLPVVNHTIRPAATPAPTPTQMAPFLLSLRSPHLFRFEGGAAFAAGASGVAKFMLAGAASSSVLPFIATLTALVRAVTVMVRAPYCTSYMARSPLAAVMVRSPARELAPGVMVSIAVPRSTFTLPLPRLTAEFEA